MSDVSVKKEYSLPNLSCANCAAKMEDEIRKLDGVIDISVVFISKTLTMELAADKADAIVEQARIIINEIEPGVVAIDVLENPEGIFDKKGNPDINNNFIRNKVSRLGLSGVFFGAAIILGHFNISPYITIHLYIISYLLSGGGILLSASRNILKGRLFDENFLMSIATLGAFAIGYFDEGVAVMLFFQVGMLLQNLAAGRSRRSIAALMDIRPDTANLVINDGIKVVSPTSIKIGESILIRPGEKVPLDGIVVEGTSMVDTSALTGESVPREVLPGNDVLAGFINRNGALTVLVSKEFGQSTVAKILNMMQNASTKKAPTENFITSFARYYTPVVTIIALLIALIPPLLFNQLFANWIYRALVFLVVSCPCALVLSIPLGFFGGIGAASRVGVLVKGSNYLEALGNINTMVFDKTGTLTQGVFEVTKIQPHGDYNNTELLHIAAHAEAHSNHPIAVSIRKAYGNNLNTSKISDFEEIAGYGTKAVVDGRTILIGNSKLMHMANVVYKTSDDLGTTAYIAVDGQFAGSITISDMLKPNALSTISRLKAFGVKKLVMLTGDNKTIAEATALELGFDATHYELLPDQKVSIVEGLLREKPPKTKLAFVGDGINDAPVLARADVGIAMGGPGSDAAIEAADIVLMADDLKSLLGAISVSRRTKRIVWQNIVITLGVKVIVLSLGAFGVASMWAAVFADVGVALLAVLNSLRVIHISKSEKAH